MNPVYDGARWDYVYDEVEDYGHDNDLANYDSIKKKKKEERDAEADLNMVYDGARWDYVYDEAGYDGEKKKGWEDAVVTQV